MRIVVGLYVLLYIQRMLVVKKLGLGLIVSQGLGLICYVQGAAVFWCNVAVYRVLAYISLWKEYLCVAALRVFSKSGLIVRSHRVRTSDSTRETLAFLAWNKF